jgi:hypothetical protein
MDSGTGSGSSSEAGTGAGKRLPQNNLSLYRTQVLDPCKYVSQPAEKESSAKDAGSSERKCAPGTKAFLGKFFLVSAEPEVFENGASDYDQTQRGLALRQVMREVECKNAFESIGLAIRHNAIIEAQSSLLQDDDISYSEEEVKEYFPNLVESPPDLRGGVCDFYDVKCELNRLERLLKESDRQGNELKSIILRQEIAQLNNTDGGVQLIDLPANINTNSNTNTAFEDKDESSSVLHGQ